MVQRRCSLGDKFSKPILSEILNAFALLPYHMILWYCFINNHIYVFSYYFPTIIFLSYFLVYSPPPVPQQCPSFQPPFLLSSSSPLPLPLGPAPLSLFLSSPRSWRGEGEETNRCCRQEQVNLAVERIYISRLLLSSESFDEEPIFIYPEQQQ